MGTTFAILHMFGKVPSAKYLFIGFGRGIEIDFLIVLRIFVGMLLGPVLLLFFDVLIMSHISFDFNSFFKKIIFVRGF